jgi:hypothetical protein
MNAPRRIDRNVLPLILSLAWASLVISVWFRFFVWLPKPGSAFALLSVWLTPVVVGIGVVVMRRATAKWPANGLSYLSCILLIVSVYLRVPRVPQVVVIWSAMVTVAIAVPVQIAALSPAKMPLSRAQGCILKCALGVLLVQFCGREWVLWEATHMYVDTGTAALSLLGVVWIMQSRQSTGGFAVVGAVAVAAIMSAMWSAEQETYWSRGQIDPYATTSHELGRALLTRIPTVLLVVLVAIARQVGTHPWRRVLVTSAPYVVLLLALLSIWARATGRLPLSPLAVPQCRFNC